MWSFHDRIYTFCKSVLFSNIECLIFEFFRFLNWRKALKVFYIWILHVKLLKYITSVQETLSLIFLICVGGVNKSLALYQLIVSFPISKEQIYVLSEILQIWLQTPIVISNFILNAPLLVSVEQLDITGLILPKAVLRTLVSYCLSMHYLLLNCTFCESTICTSTVSRKLIQFILLLDSTLKEFW